MSTKAGSGALHHSLKHKGTEKAAIKFIYILHRLTPVPMQIDSPV